MPKKLWSFHQTPKNTHSISESANFRYTIYQLTFSSIGRLSLSNSALYFLCNLHLNKPFASGACTVVIAVLCVTHRPEYLNACTILAGLCQILSGVMGLGKLIRLVPNPVMLGFVDGLGELPSRVTIL